MQYNVVVKDNLKSPVCKRKCFFFQIRPYKFCWKSYARFLQLYLHLAFWTIDEWRTWCTKKSLPKKAILFSQFEGFEFGSLAWKICEMVGKKKGFIFIADIFARLFRIYSKRRIRKAFFYEMKKKLS